MKLAYFDCFSGVSGDMALGALVDLGVPVDWIAAQIRQIPLGGFALKEARVSKSHIAATKVDVCIDDAGVSRTWYEIRRLIGEADLPKSVRHRSLAVFSRLAAAEARIHGCAVDEVHFHEVGGTDAIVDVVGTVAGLHRLGVDRIVSSPLPLGRGFVDCRHGRLPVPAPATVRLLEEIPVYGVGAEAELVTPTGAALIAALAEDFGALPEMRIEASGYGAGSAELPDRPNLLRILIGTRHTDAEGGVEDETVVVLEAAVDDMNPEFCGFLMERLFAEGALDASFTPVYMKKNRPGVRLEVLCAPGAKERLLAVLFSESTTTGVRYRHTARRILPREAVVLDTEFGPLSAKQVRLPGGGLRVFPEYESCRRAALDRGVPVLAVYEAALRGSLRDGGGQQSAAGPESV